MRHLLKERGVQKDTTFKARSLEAWLAGAGISFVVWIASFLIKY